ncbi:MAG: hypothetical protein Q9160_000221 [Pyrenula sp. 1 TL-2023]
MASLHSYLPILALFTLLFVSLSFAVPENVVENAITKILPTLLTNPDEGINVQTVVQLGSNKVIVGDPADLDTKIIDALKAACDGGLCSTNDDDKQEIDGIGWIDKMGHRQYGKLIVSIQEADIFSEAQMAKLTTLVAAAVKQSATGDNCSKPRWNQGCGASIAGGGAGRAPAADVNDCQHGEQTVCSGVNTVNVVVLNKAQPDKNIDTSIHAKLTVNFNWESGTTPFSCQNFVDGISSIVGHVGSELDEGKGGDGNGSKKNKFKKIRTAAGLDKRFGAEDALGAVSAMCGFVDLVTGASGGNK